MASARLLLRSKVLIELFGLVLLILYDSLSRWLIIISVAEWSLPLPELCLKSFLLFLARLREIYLA